MKDRFGTEILWPADQLAAMPHVTESNKVISDICEWKEQLKMPELLERALKGQDLNAFQQELSRTSNAS